MPPVASPPTSLVAALPASSSASSASASASSASAASASSASASGSIVEEVWIIDVEEMDDGLIKIHLVVLHVFVDL